MKTNLCSRVFFLMLLLQPLFAVAQESAAVSGSGTTNFIPLWKSPTALGSSNMFENSSGNVGIGTTLPAAKLDVKGSGVIRGLLTLTPSSTSNALNVSGTAFSIDHTGHLHFASGQSFPGTGTITGVSAGTGLLGGGSSGNVSLSLNTAFTDGRYAQPGISNTFTADQFFSFGVFAASLSSTGDVSANGNVDALVGRVQGQVGSFGFSNVGGQSLFSVTGNATQALQVQSFFPPANNAFVEAQFDTNGNATFFTDSLGDTTARGTKSAAVSLQDGTTVKVFSVESPEVWFEDFGSGRLTGGIATVPLDPKFVQTVNIAAGYHVFVMPKGDCKGLFVTDETDNGFEVRELGGGESTIDFDYRIVAHRSGYELARLPEAEMPKATTTKVLGSRK